MGHAVSNCDRDAVTVLLWLRSSLCAALCLHSHVDEHCNTNFFLCAKRQVGLHAMSHHESKCQRARFSSTPALRSAARPVDMQSVGAAQAPVIQQCTCALQCFVQVTCGMA